jgi:hypothetical protein
MGRSWCRCLFSVIFPRFAVTGWVRGGDTGDSAGQSHFFISVSIVWAHLVVPVVVALHGAIPPLYIGATSTLAGQLARRAFGETLGAVE